MATWTPKVDHVDKVLAADINALQTLKADIKKALAANLGTLDAGEFGLETDTREVHIGSSVGNIRIHGSYITPEMYGGGPAKSAAINSAAIQAAINAQVSLGHREVVIRKGTYQLAHHGADPNIAGYNHCLNIPSGARIILEWGAVLNLAASQSTDAAPVNVLTLGNVSDVYIGGEGKITQNCANQPGWTGGYAQQVGGALIMQKKTINISGLKLEGLTLDGCFGTVVDLRGGDAANLLSDVFLKELTVRNVGEGLLVCWAKRVTVEGCKASDPDDVQVGDGIEMAGVDGFYLHKNSFFNAVAPTHGGGSAYDIYGSLNGIIDGFLIDKWSVVTGMGIDISWTNAYYAGVNTKNFVIKNGIVKNCPGVGLAVRAGHLENLIVSDVIFEANVNHGIQMGWDNVAVPGPVTVENVILRGNSGNGASFASVKNLLLKTVQAIGNTVHGIEYICRASIAAQAEVSGVIMEGIIARDNTAGGIVIGPPVGGFNPQVTISNPYLAGNGYTPPISINGAVAAKCNIRIRDVGPVAAIAVENGHSMMMYAHVFISGDLTTLTGGTRGRKLTLVSWGAYTITHSVATDRFFLQGSVNFVTKSGDVLEVEWIETQWYETGRMVS